MEMAAVVSSAPCRADLAGGTLDIWPLGILHPGAITVNVAIPLRTELVVERNGAAGEVHHTDGHDSWQRLTADSAETDLTAAICFALIPEGGLRVRVLNQAPIGSGIGGSSTYGIALCRALLALCGQTMENTEVVALIRDLEARIISAPTGTQDYWAAVLGGVLALHLEPGNEHPEQLAIDQEWLGERLTVFYTGITHHSGMLNWQVIRRRLEGDAECAAALDQIGRAARSCRDALIACDEAAVAEAVSMEWAARQCLAPDVSNSELGRLEEHARAAGATAFKACGAGGGGSVLLWHPAGMRKQLSQALTEAMPAGQVLTAGVAEQGCKLRQLDTDSQS
jgi:D-glycero-alpha-D-manno-heptose-7-phosphate kinase